MHSGHFVQKYNAQDFLGTSVETKTASKTGRKEYLFGIVHITIF